MIHYLLPLPLLLAGCMTLNLPPSQKQMQSSKQEQSQTNEQNQTQAQDSAQTSSHASESKQGTNSMPVIVICTTNNSPNSSCAALPRDNPLQPAIRKEIRNAPNN